jgi:hypothetical protein
VGLIVFGVAGWGLGMNDKSIISVTENNVKKAVGRPRGNKQTEVIRVDILRWSFLKRVERLSGDQYAAVVGFLNELQGGGR